MNHPPYKTACLFGVLILGLSWPSRTRADTPAADLNNLVQLVVSSESDPALQRDLLKGGLDALSGRRRMPMPSSWPTAYPKLAASNDPEVRNTATKLALLFGDPSAFKTLRDLARQSGKPAKDRVDAIATLAQARDEGLARLLQGLLADPDVRAAALRGLAAADDPGTPGVILKAYPTLTLAEKADALGTLAVRPAYALALLDAVEKGTVPKAEVAASALQALAGHSDPKVKAKLAQVWGTVRPSSSDKRAAIAQWKADLTPDVLAKADRTHGRSVFDRTCAGCHRMFDAGGNVGPELTGSQRANLDYVLTNVVDPSAIVGRDYQVTVFQTADGRVVSGIVRREDDRSVTVQTATDVVVIPTAEIESRKVTKDSMMPEGQLNTLGRDDVRDLVAYLASPAQVAPSPVGKSR